MLQSGLLNCKRVLNRGRICRTAKTAACVTREAVGLVVKDAVEKAGRVGKGRQALVWVFCEGRGGRSRHTSTIAPIVVFGLSQSGVYRGHHDVSTSARMTGARVSTTTIRPWRQTGHCCREEPVRFS